MRRNLFAQAGLLNAQQVLEVGCGTGAIISDLHTQANIVALDIDISRLDFAKDHTEDRASFLGGDGHQLPIASKIFDITFCHFLLLWVSNPEKVLSEMVRVTRAGGTVIAFAEPDYGGRIDYPEELAELGILQKKSLEAQGADPNMGRKVPSLFIDAGLGNVQFGVLQGHWTDPPSHEDIEMEWDVIKSDLKGEIDSKRIDQLHHIDMKSWQSGKRVLFVPTFYAIGNVA